MEEFIMNKVYLTFVFSVTVIFANEGLFKGAFDCKKLATQNFKSFLDSGVSDISPLGRWANSQGLCLNAADNMFMLTLNNNVLAVFKAYQNLGFAFAEAAAFNASDWLGLDLVPYTQVKRFVDVEGVQKNGSAIVWVDHIYSKLPASISELRTRIGEDQFAKMQIFYFLLGQYDRHFGNQVVYNCDGEVRVGLIDNGAIAAKQLVESYGSLPWVAMARAKNLTEEQPATLWESLKTKQNPEDIFAQFSEFDFYTNRDIKEGYAHIWNGYLWRQFYGPSTNLGPAFSDKIDSALLAKLKELDAAVVKSFWSEFPEQWDAERIDEWVNGVLERRDMIVKYFEEHPEGVVS
jgi:hypothetical protein